MERRDTSSAHHVRFHFDPVCPWTWRASLWIRGAAQVRPLTIEWGLLSLAYLNRNEPNHPMRDRHLKSLHALRLLAEAREIGGNQAIGRLYLAVGTARHERGQELDDQGMLHGALKEAGLPAGLLEKTRENASLDKSLQDEYESVCARGAIGVPTLFIDHGEVPYFGPVISSVPSDARAGELWDLIAGLSLHEYFHEIKRPRV